MEGLFYCSINLGGISMARKRTADMTEEARQARNEYMRAWRRANKEKVKQYNIAHWENKALEAVR